MRDIHLKIRLIYIPFLMVSAGFIMTYTFLHWLLILKLELLKMEEMYTDYWIPVAIILVLLFTVVRKKIKLMNLTTGGGGDLSRLYYLIATLTFGIPTVIGQAYIRTSTGELASLASAEQMDLKHGPKYYQFEKIYLDKRFTGVFWYTDTSGKYNTTLNFHGFFALPLMSSPQDTTRKYFNKWYGVEYKDDMSNKATQMEKDIAFRRFQQSCILKYGRANLYNFVYLDRIGRNRLQEGLLSAVDVTSNYDHTMEPIILQPVDEPFELRNGSKLEWMIGSYMVCALIWLLMVLYTPLYLDKAKKSLCND